ncbi:hypothetical protein Goklo_027683, partial [Gossypium klotzschianum]|nr:hypothetical protein [Gossypium klotzschianum]
MGTVGECARPWRRKSRRGRILARIAINSEPVQKYYQRADAIFDSGITSDEVLSKAFEELGLSVEELLQQFESWQLILSKVY